jgi:hypothetical protein
MAPKTTYDTPCELAYRAVNGLEVTLNWHRAEDRLSVSVYDAKLGDFFEVPAPHDRALDVFYHPFAFAAHEGIEYGVGVVEHADTVDV